ncbi:hypothetical protein JOM56_010910 [Amanita muscaria]
MNKLQQPDQRILYRITAQFFLSFLFFLEDPVLCFSDHSRNSSISAIFSISCFDQALHSFRKHTLFKSKPLHPLTLFASPYECETKGHTACAPATCQAGGATTSWQSSQRACWPTPWTTQE